ncbi:MAG: alanine--tRNA ligase [Acidobacteria bacterium]|nr:alanine--tRNA ligase [Acidobacteriota bacterium]
MKASDVREKFLSYFEERGHERVESSSLIPGGDATLLFTNAGMNQFKDVFLGREERDYERAASSQKCVRAGGKHNDLENVGRTARHHTFFEMLGNFSFGDYFKKDAVEFAWDLIVNELGLDPERLWFTVFEGDAEVGADEEAERMWIEAGAKPERVLRFGRKDNFWQMGDTGPCGPCSEIHYYRGADMSKNTVDLVNGEGDDTLEIWNLVFMQYDRDSSGTLTPLPAPSVDTGAGLERLASILQNVPTNYDTDLFTPVMRRIEKISGHEYGGSFESEQDTAVRVLCDHARASAFLIADGVLPSPEGRSYVLRRIIRRAIRFGRKLPEPVVLSQLLDPVIEAMGEQYPNLIERKSVITKTLEAEEERFGRTLSVGMERVGDVLDALRQRGERVLGGAEVFRLYDTWGIPIELIRELGEEEGVTIDEAGYEEQMASQRERAKAASKFRSEDVEVFAEIAERVGEITFVGYDDYVDVETKIEALVMDGEEVDRIPAGKSGHVVLNPTPFYAEAGGQIGDTGTLVFPGGNAEVRDTIRPVGDLVTSIVTVTDGELKKGASVVASVPRPVRRATTSNHTATHLLHQALKDVLGETVQQAGSLVAPDRLRFDYSWNKPLTEDQIRQVEDIVNERIRENLDVGKRVVPIDEARSLGAVAMFGEKYGDMVRIVSAGDYSLEFCGGCHVNRTGDIGVFKIVSDRSLASGVRRMEAVTGPGAVEYIRELESGMRAAQSALNVGMGEVPRTIEQVQTRQRELEREVRDLRMKLAAAGAGATSSSDEGIVEVAGLQLIVRRADEVQGGDLRNLADTLRKKIDRGVVVIGSAHKKKATLLVAVTSNVSESLSAKDIIDRLAPIVDGRGGGKNDLAQAGGKAPEQLDEALAKAKDVVGDLMSVATG